MGLAAVNLTPPAYGITAADSPIIQTKLIVGSATDSLEQEADQAAEKVVSLWQGGTSGFFPKSAFLPKNTEGSPFLGNGVQQNILTDKAKQAIINGDFKDNGDFKTQKGEKTVITSKRGVSARLLTNNLTQV